MRRLLIPLLLLSLAPLAPASAACDPETGECYPTDCMPWQPRPPSLGEIKEDLANGEVNVLSRLLPPTCP